MDGPQDCGKSRPTSQRSSRYRLHRSAVLRGWRHERHARTVAQTAGWERRPVHCDRYDSGRSRCAAEKTPGSGNSVQSYFQRNPGKAQVPGGLRRSASPKEVWQAGTPQQCGSRRRTRGTLPCGCLHPLPRRPYLPAQNPLQEAWEDGDGARQPAANKYSAGKRWHQSDQETLRLLRTHAVRLSQTGWGRVSAVAADVEKEGERSGIVYRCDEEVWPGTVPNDIPAAPVHFVPADVYRCCRTLLLGSAARENVAA